MKRSHKNAQSVELYQQLHKEKTITERQPTDSLVGEKSNLGHVHTQEAGKKFELNKNPFPTLYIDLTLRCNYACNVCYNPVLPRKDLDVTEFERVAKELPNPVEFRLLGGEPTIHENFFDFVDIGHKYGHSIYVSTNGRKIVRDQHFAKELAKRYHNGKMRIHTDFSAGYSEELSELIYGDSNAVHEKFQFLKKCEELKISRVTLSQVVIRGVNDHIMGDLVEIANKHGKVVREIAYKSQGNVGRYITDSNGQDLLPYKTNDWIRMMMDQGLLTQEHMAKTLWAGYKHKECEGKNCCIQLPLSRKLIVSWVDFLTETCWFRGQLRVTDGKIADNAEYMYESLQSNDVNKLIAVKQL